MWHNSNKWAYHVWKFVFRLRLLDNVCGLVYLLGVWVVVDFCMSFVDLFVLCWELLGYALAKTLNIFFYFISLHMTFWKGYIFVGVWQGLVLMKGYLFWYWQIFKQAKSIQRQTKKYQTKFSLKLLQKLRLNFDLTQENKSMWWRKQLTST